MTNSKKNVLIFCSNSYIFEETYLPIINEGYKKWKIDLLIAERYFYERIEIILKKLQKDKKILSYKTIRHIGFSEFSLKEIFFLINYFSKKEFDVLIHGGDVEPINKYLIGFTKKNAKCKTFLIQENTLWRILEERVVDLHKYKNKIKKFFSSPEFILKKILLLCINYLKNTFRHFKLTFFSFFHHKVMPFLLFRKTFTNKYKEYAFMSGCSDFLFVYENSTVKTIKEKCW